MISLNALITPGDNSIMIVAIKLGFHQDPQTEGGKAIIPLMFRYDVASNIMILGLFGGIYDTQVRPYCQQRIIPLTKPRH